jgi:two-component system OmpR family response regulator
MSTHGRPPNKPIFDDGDVFALTSKGQKELRGASTSLAPAELEVLVLIDGHATVGETAGRTRAAGTSVRDVLLKLWRAKLVEMVDPSDSGFIDLFKIEGPLGPSANALADAKKRADSTTLLLQQKGYTVRIARKRTLDNKSDRGGALTAVVVDDDPQLAKLVSFVLTTEGFQVRTAGNANEIVAAIRQAPVPDLILLDVGLPDVDGFDVLQRIRRHPVLKAIPVVMLTAEATRDAVLKGLAGGADGYITKPFEIEALLKAVTAVLGLPHGGVSEDDNADPWGPSR